MQVKQYMFDSYINHTDMCVCMCSLDVEQILRNIQHEKPYWGTCQPKEWATWIHFGPGGKKDNVAFAPRLWTITGARAAKRKNAGREHQRKVTKMARSLLREEADARFAILCVLFMLLFMLLPYLQVQKQRRCCSC